MIRFKPWRRQPDGAEQLEQSRRALEQAQEWEARSRRVAKATERAIVQNHFANDIRKAMEGL